MFLILSLKGVPIRSLSKEKGFEGRCPTWKTIWSWLLTFSSLLLKNYGRKFEKVSDDEEWQTDETYIKMTEGDLNSLLEQSVLKLRKYFSLSH